MIINKNKNDFIPKKGSFRKIQENYLRTQGLLNEAFNPGIKKLMQQWQKEKPWEKKQSLAWLKSNGFKIGKGYTNPVTEKLFPLFNTSLGAHIFTDPDETTQALLVFDCKNNEKMEFNWDGRISGPNPSYSGDDDGLIYTKGAVKKGTTYVNRSGKQKELRAAATDGTWFCYWYWFWPESKLQQTRRKW